MSSTLNNVPSYDYLHQNLSLKVTRTRCVTRSVMQFWMLVWNRIQRSRVACETATKTGYVMLSGRNHHDRRYQL